MAVDPEYTEVLTDLEVCMMEIDTEFVMIGGDMNTDLRRRNAQVMLTVIH